MANTQSAKKRIRQIERRTKVRRDRLNRIRTFIKRVEKAIQSGDRPAAEAAYKKMQPELQRGGTKDVLHKRTIARKQSRLANRIQAL